MFSFSGQASTRTAVSENVVINNSLSAYENVTTHEGDLIINGTQDYAIRDCWLVQKGSIYVRDSAKLSIDNATLTLILQYDNQHYVSLEDYATVEVVDSRISFDSASGSYARYGCLSLNGYAKVSIKNSTFNNDVICSYGSSFVAIVSSTIKELLLHDASQVSIENSTVTFLVNLIFDFTRAAHLDGLKAGYQENWNLHRNETVQNVLYDLTVKSSLIAWGLKIIDDAAVEISNCEIERLLLELYNAADVENISEGEYKDWRFASILLSNSYVKSWYVCVHDTRVYVENCQLEGLEASGNSTISLTQSSVSQLGISPTSYATIEFDETVLAYFFAVTDSNVYVHGNVTFSLQTLGFLSSNLTRNYNSIVTDINDNLMENAGLTLFDRDSKPIWNGTTNSLGQADFNVTFTDSNYTDTLRLNISQEGYYNEAEYVGFLSDTPVSIVLTEMIPGDVNWDRWVSLADLVLLAQAYGSKPGDSNWNANADIDGNSAVALPDLVALAQHYGQHYP
jgi:hypothetical protein